MQINGREKERKELRRLERSAKSELVCVYGRRRVGKTFLVEQSFSGTFAFRATGVEDGNTREQLKSFQLRLREYGDPCKAIPADWFEAFSRLESLLKKDDVTRSPHGKKVIFLDEFPWFATARSGFLKAFGEFWNRCGTATGDYLLIICGSATSWIIHNVLENTGSLFNRVTCQIHLAPFTLDECERFFADREFGWSRAQIMECRMVFGGLPFFLDLLYRDESLHQNIDRLLFAPHALLQNESKRLLEATLRKSPAYGHILEVLAAHPHGLKRSACFDTLSVPKGTFVRAVDDLVKCGYITEYKSYHHKNNPLMLQLADPFLLFHYNILHEKTKKRVQSFREFAADTGRYTNWRGHAFEILCLHHLEQILRALGISGVRTLCYPWVSEKKRGGAQIDLIIERDDGITNICEMKYTDRPFKVSVSEEKALLQKANVFRTETKTTQSLRIILISSQGISGTANTEHITDILTAEDLFA